MKPLSVKSISKLFEDLCWVDSFNIRHLNRGGGIIDFYTTVSVEDDFKKLQILDERTAQLAAVVGQPMKRGSVKTFSNPFIRALSHVIFKLKGGVVNAGRS